ncbi:MAG: lamin tail domain-containing protein [Candidatus Sumerlaeaceae bacterium]|nr:lamin tail domain-containing protein [Candidatus Sumerlaeaceae bacterium]
MGKAAGLRHTLAAGLLVARAASAQAQVVINEFVYDDTGTDSIEFVELYNAGSAPADISGFTVVGINSPPSFDSVSTIPGAPGSGTTVLPAGGFYVLGMAGVPNLNLDVTAAPDWQNSMEALALRNGAGAVVDSVVYERNKATPVLAAGYGEPPFDGLSAVSGGGIWSNCLSVEANGADGGGFASGGPLNATFSWARMPDGRDTGDNETDFFLTVATPGASNGSAGTVSPASLPYIENFDAPDGTTITALGGSRSSMIVHHPAVADPLGGLPSANPSVIPPSPQGGNVGVFWSGLGGQNSGALALSAPVADVRAEFYAYFPGVLGVGQSEQGTLLVVRGHSDGEYSPGIANGDTGIRWVWTNDESGVRLRLEQRVNGISSPIGSEVPIFSAGWQRLLLVVQGSSVHGVVGGAYGTTTGTHVLDGTTTLTRAGGIGFGYVENLSPNTLARPNTYDALRIESAAPPAEVRQWWLY